MRLPQTVPTHAPRGRLRGKGRFFRKVMREARGFRVPANPDDWRDLWHYHSDWKGHRWLDPDRMTQRVSFVIHSPDFGTSLE